MAYKSKNTLCLLGLLLILCSNLFGQQGTPEVNPPDYIKTIQIIGDSDLSEIPIIPFGQPLHITFDDINGDEANYYYKITHYNFDWTPSSLYKNEYLHGFDETRIVNYENSFNTLQLYSHYSLRIPNEDTRGFKVSGNYIIEVYDSNGDTVFLKKFIVYEDLTSVKINIKRSRDLKYIDTKQSVQFEINSPNEILKNPKRNVKTLIIQNNDLKSAITNLIPQYVIADKLVYKYDQESSFWAGNEFLYFDNKEIRSSTANIKSVELLDIYNNYLYTDVERSSKLYTYYPDINGNFKVRNLRTENSDIEADYAWVHFSLQNFKPIGDSEIHVFGNFNNYTIDDSTKLKYNKKTGLFHTKILFKQGFYNYKYVLVKSNGAIDPGFICGNHDETENKYTMVPYYRPPGGRYDRAIGKAVGSSVDITN